MVIIYHLQVTQVVLKSNTLSSALNVEVSGNIRTTNLLFFQKSRGPTLGEISYALAEITEIKLEIAKSQAHQKSVHSKHVFREIS